MNGFTVDVRFDFPFDDLEDQQLISEIEQLLEEELLDDLHRAALLTLAHQGVEPPAALTVLLTGDEALQIMNREFRGLDTPTDVLSFESDLEIPEVGRYLGDIAIAIPTALRQAAAHPHNPRQEFELLTVHGVLHLLGHDHAEEDEKKKMWEAQEEIQNQLKINN